MKSNNNNNNENGRYYIAYGSNLNSAQMRKRCKVKGKCKCAMPKIEGTTIIRDYRLVFRKSSEYHYFTIDKCPGYEVPAGVWKITAEHEKRLDSFEGYPEQYGKSTITVDILKKDGTVLKEQKCLVYILPESREAGLPESEYIERCTVGYLEFCFDTEYLKKAVNDTAELSGKQSEKTKAECLAKIEKTEADYKQSVSEP